MASEILALLFSSFLGTILAITFLENVFRRYFAYHLVQHEILSHVTYWKGVKGVKGQRSTR